MFAWPAAEERGRERAEEVLGSRISVAALLLLLVLCHVRFLWFYRFLFCQLHRQQKQFKDNTECASQEQWLRI